MKSQVTTKQMRLLLIGCLRFRHRREGTVESGVTSELALPIIHFTKIWYPLLAMMWSH